MGDLEAQVAELRAAGEGATTELKVPNKHNRIIFHGSSQQTSAVSLTVCVC